MLERKSLEAAAPTSLIIKRSRHPFFEKKDAESILMELLDLLSRVILMESGRVVVL